MVYDGSIPSPTYLVNVCSSTIVMTVSRCMNARFWGMANATMRCRAPGPEQPPGQPFDALGCGALAHADQHGAAAEDQDVTALGGGLSVDRPLRPDVERCVGEERVPAVDRLVVDRLPDPRPLAHGVDRHPVVDPRGRVSGKHVVRQRRQQNVVESESLHDDRRRLVGALEQLALGHAADEVAGQLDVVHGAEDAVQAVHRHRTVDALVEGLLENELAGLRHRHRLAQQLVEHVHLARRGRAATRQRRRAPAWHA